MMESMAESAHDILVPVPVGMKHAVEFSFEGRAEDATVREMGEGMIRCIREQIRPFLFSPDTSLAEFGYDVQNVDRNRMMMKSCGFLTCSVPADASEEERQARREDVFGRVLHNARWNIYRRILRQSRKTPGFAFSLDMQFLFSSDFVLEKVGGE